jgi:hypothetical protein
MQMRKGLLTLALAGTLMMAPGFIPAAHAQPGHGWLSVGSGFRVGGLNLSLVFGRPFGYNSYYYRFPRPISYHGAHCTSRCFVDHGVHYHVRGCPVVDAYFHSYGADPYQYYSRYAPRYDGYYNDGYYNPSYYDSYYDRGYYGGGVSLYYNRGYSRDRHYDRGDRYDRGYRDRDRHYDRRYDRGHDRRDNDHRSHDRDRDHDRRDRDWDRDGGHRRGGSRHDRH